MKSAYKLNFFHKEAFRIKDEKSEHTIKFKTLFSAAWKENEIKIHSE